MRARATAHTERSNFISDPKPSWVSRRVNEVAKRMPALGVANAIVLAGTLVLVGCLGEEKIAEASANGGPALTPVLAAAAQAPKAPAPKQLTRAEAKRLLVKLGRYPLWAGTDTFGIGDGVWCDSPPKLFGELGNYVKRGLVSVTPGPESTGDNRCRDERGYHFDVELTPLGKKYELGENRGLVDVKLCIGDLGEVTGVVSESDGTSATVEFTLVKRPTPFGEGRCFGQRTESATFRRYDDGWRIVR
jgi:hypothetical protein